MKNFILGFYMVGFSISAFGMGAKAPDEKITYGDCSFACQEIPPDSEVLLKTGTASVPTLGEGPEHKIRVAAWNIHKQKDENSPTELNELFKNSDLVLLQEVELNNVFPVPTFMETLLATSFITSRDAPTGVANISRSASIFSDFRRTMDLEPFVKSPKAQAISKYSLGTHPSDPQLLVINIHGINRRDTDALERQLSQIQPFIVNHVGPVIYAGDFNTRNSSRLKMTRAWAKSLDLTEVFFNGDNRKDTNRLDLCFVRGLKTSNTQFTLDPTASDHPLFQFDAEINK